MTFIKSLHTQFWTGKIPKVYVTDVSLLETEDCSYDDLMKVKNRNERLVKDRCF